MVAGSVPKRQWPQPARRGPDLNDVTREIERVGPVAGVQRIVALDVLRGVAVLGILGTNIQHFAMFAGTVRDPTLYGNLDGANFWVYALTFTFVYQKFLPIFAMLFGTGILLAADRREAAGVDPSRFHYRRMAVLLVIGLCHAYLIWYGDILVAYALSGMVAFQFRRVSPRGLFAMGIALLAASPVIRVLFFILPGMLGAAGGDGGQGIEQVIANDLEAFRGPWIEQFRTRAAYVLEGQTTGFAVVLFWRACGLMAIGMGLYKLGVMTGRRSGRFYATLAAVALAIAVPVTALGLTGCVVTNWDNFWLWFLSDQIIYWFGIVMSLGWISIVMLACRRGCRSWLGHSLAAVGRLALTNYLLQSLLCTFLFYGHGLGLYGSVERTGQVAIVAGVWLLQLIISPLWLQYFRFGPAEWVWRILTYGYRQSVILGRR
jgi:uncharacterized protein